MRLHLRSLILLAFGLCTGLQLMACNLSDFNFNSITPVGNHFLISTTLHVGRGITGVVKGGNNATNTISFEFFQDCPGGIQVLSVSPSTLTGGFTGCPMPSTIFNGPGSAIGAQASVMFIDPAYYGFHPICTNRPFGCVNSTALCGNAGQDTYTIVFDVNQLPDSIRVLGVEAAGNPTGGCYPNMDMLVPICGSVNYPASFVCPGPQQVNANASCIGVLPNYASLANQGNCCSTVTLSQNPAAGTTIGGLGSTLNVTLWPSSLPFGSATCTFLVSVVDHSPPLFNTCPGNQGVAANALCQFTLPNYLSLAAATDACDPTLAYTQSPAPGATVTGSVTVNIFAQDDAGNRDTCTFLVNGFDAIAPTITCPATQTLNVNANCQLVMPNLVGLGSATDNCGAVASFTHSPAVGTTVSGLGAHTVTLTATDGGGNSSTCNFTVILRDATPPTVTCPGQQNVSLNANCQFVMPDYTNLATVTDNCATVFTRTQTPAVGSILSGTGSTTVTIAVADGNGNTGTCTFTLNRQDNTPPTLICPANQTVALNASCFVFVPNYVTLANASDNCGSSPVVTQSPASTTALAGTGVTTVTLSATDIAGNSSTCTFTLTRVDNTPPTINCPSVVTLPLNANCQASIPNYTITANASDNCTAAPGITQSPAIGTIFTSNTTVTLTANDASGNTSSCTITVNGMDVTSPTVLCPPNIVVTPVILDCTPAVSWTVPTATDNCQLASLNGNHNPGDPFGPGMTTVTYTATDGVGNIGSCSFTITVLSPVLNNVIASSNPAPCTGDTVTLTATGVFAGLVWSSGQTSSSIDVTSNGWYWVDVNDGNGCIGRDSLLVNFLPAPQPIVSQNGNQACTTPFTSYQWLLNGSPIPGEIGQCTPITTNGSYAVQVTGANGCTAISAPLLLTGRVEATRNSFVVYPVPAQERLQVQLPTAINAPCELKLYDLSGRVVRTWSLQNMDILTELMLENIAQGSYLLELRSEEFFGTKRVVRL